jgi:hypothetical protein
VIAVNEPQRLPSEPNIAFALAIFYKHLGGWLAIDSRGKRGFGRPCLSDDDALPQLRDAASDEQFHNRDEWAGAIKFIEALLRRLDDADLDLVFGTLATEAIDPRKLSPSIEEPRIWRRP